MEVDFKELHFAARAMMKKVHSRGVQEKVMSKPPRKRARIMEVQIMFEPNRLQQHSLHKAYTYLVPILKRRLMMDMTAIEATAQAPEAARERTMP